MHGQTHHTDQHVLSVRSRGTAQHVSTLLLPSSAIQCLEAYATWRMINLGGAGCEGISRFQGRGVSLSLGFCHFSNAPALTYAARPAIWMSACVSPEHLMYEHRAATRRYVAVTRGP